MTRSRIAGRIFDERASPLDLVGALPEQHHEEGLANDQ